MRKSGILLPVFSLPGPYGIGSFGSHAYRFVDFLESAGQHYWQILPLDTQGYGDSPYQSFSAFALNPYLIDLDMLIEQGYLHKGELADIKFGDNPKKVDYFLLYTSRLKLLHRAADRFDTTQTPFIEFCMQEEDWLDDYALFMSIKEENNEISMLKWPEVQRMKLKNEETCRRLERPILFWKIVQYWAFEQWLRLKEYANSKGIEIIGDMPIYVAADSADLWANPELFDLDEEGHLLEVAGCPPDGFSPKGQLWGHPLYRWGYHKETNYAWWRKRIRRAAHLYDGVRIDHFRGLESYYAVPAKEHDARFGCWRKGPGLPFIRRMQEEAPDLKVIVEDLGYVTAEVKNLVEESGLPGMKILQFAFDSREQGDYLPYCYPRNSVVYTGTHDNNTLEGWQREAMPRDVAKALFYYDTDLPQLTMRMVRAALECVSDTAIIPMQDWLRLGSEARINTPATLGNNWCWRMEERALTPRLAKEIYSLTKIYGRL